MDKRSAIHHCPEKDGSENSVLKRILTARLGGVEIHVLDFGDRGWLAIDPKGLIGERGFDYANIFCNPDLSHPMPLVATLPEVFAARLALVVNLANLEPSRLLHWILAWAGLCAAWIIAGGQTPATSLAVAQLAADELDR